MTEKNKKKLEAKKHRAWWDMNLGERPHKSPKDYDRNKSKREVRKECDE